jgi:hypothetical protein
VKKKRPKDLCLNVVLGDYENYHRKSVCEVEILAQKLKIDKPKLESALLHTCNYSKKPIEIIESEEESEEEVKIKKVRRKVSETTVPKHAKSTGVFYFLNRY